ncbi:MAG: hypothetical protein WAT79_09350 [Saprospiraceae bacterium]
MKLLNIFTLVFFLFLVSCIKNEEIFIPSQPTEDPAFLYSQSFNNPTHYLIECGKTTQFFITDNQSILKIPVGSLLDQNGNIFVGTVEMEIIETNNLADLILQGKVYVVQNQLISSKWLLYLNFKGHGKELLINPLEPIEWFTNISSEETSSFIYEEVTSENKLKNWVQKSSAPIQNWNVEQDDWMASGSGCSFTISKKGWHLIGNPMTFETENESRLCVKANSSFTSHNSIVFAIINDHSIVLPLSHLLDEGYYCKDMVKLPLNSGIKFVLISYQHDGKHYFTEATTKIDSPIVQEMNPEIKTLEEIVRRLKGL